MSSLWIMWKKMIDDVKKYEAAQSLSNHLIKKELWPGIVVIAPGQTPDADLFVYAEDENKVPKEWEGFRVLVVPMPDEEGEFGMGGDWWKK